MVSDPCFLALTRATMEGRWPAIRRRAGSHHFRTDPNISSFDRNATPVEPDNGIRARPPRSRNMSCYFNGLCGLELAKQQQDDEHDQNDPEKAHSGVAVAVTVTAEPAAEAAQQENNQDDDEYQSKRHGTLPNRRPANGHSPSAIRNKA